MENFSQSEGDLDGKVSVVKYYSSDEESNLVNDLALGILEHNLEEFKEEIEQIFEEEEILQILEDDGRIGAYAVGQISTYEHFLILEKEILERAEVQGSILVLEPEEVTPEACGEGLICVRPVCIDETGMCILPTEEPITIQPVEPSDITI